MNGSCSSSTPVGIALAICLCREWEEVGKDKAKVASNDFWKGVL